MRELCFILLVLVGAGCARAQSHNVPLSERDTDKVREAANVPPERIKLFIGFINERADGIRAASAPKRVRPTGEPAQIHTLLDEFTRLLDELQDNLDTYADQHYDIRKQLHAVNEANVRWQEALKLPPPDPAYEFERKTAIEAAASAAESTQKLINEQMEYFKDKKNKPKPY